MCGALPGPPEPKVSWPGRAFASAMSSFTDFTGTDGRTTNSNGEDVMSVIGAKSRIGS